MGYYVNPDNESLITSLNSKPYVDKSGLIGVLNENVNTNHAIVIELKVDQSTEVALKQIDSRHYTKGLEHYHGNVLKVAVNYNRKNKEHECEIREETV